MYILRPLTSILEKMYDFIGTRAILVSDFDGLWDFINEHVFLEDERDSGMIPEISITFIVYILILTV
jgi:hypothetical protein